MKKKKRSIFPLVLLCVLFAGAAAFCAYKVGFTLREYKGYENAFSSLAESFVSERVSEKPEKDKKKKTCPVKPDFKALKKENADIIAWLYAKGAGINYPVVQSGDNDTYLRRDLAGEYSIAGTLFADYRGQAEFSSFYSIIYGHNMHNGTMFGTLSEYSTGELVKKQPVIWLVTPTEELELIPFAGFDTAPDSFVYDMGMSRDEGFIGRILEHSDFGTDIDPESIERIVALSTCSDEGNTLRYVLFCAVQPAE